MNEKKSYTALFLIFAYLIGVIALTQMNNFDLHAAMNQFMGGFFLIFSFFKIINLTDFVIAYAGYDIIAKRSRNYGYVYPFLELGLGIAYLAHFRPQFTNTFTLVLMLVSSIGVIQSLLNKKKIECACLGTVIKLPMSTITLLEDLLMAGMALVSLL